MSDYARSLSFEILEIKIPRLSVAWVKYALESHIEEWPEKNFPMLVYHNWLLKLNFQWKK